MKTGIFFHYQQGERLRDFPQALEEVLAKDNILFYDALYPNKPASSFDLPPVPMEAVYKVHSMETVGSVIESGCFEGALYSAAGTLDAARRICSEELINAFVFTGYGDHHAGSIFFGGGCYLNGAVIAIHEIRRSFNIRRFAIIDTDAHHGDGTWELTQYDPNVLYVCFCNGPFQEQNSNFDIPVPHRLDDDMYVSIVRDSLIKRVRPFKPELIFWNWGYRRHNWRLWRPWTDPRRPHTPSRNNQRNGKGRMRRS